MRNKLAIIDKILCISCEHQPYRRAAQITALQLNGCPLEKFEIIWGNHRKDYSDVQLVEMLESHGLPNHRGVLDMPASHSMRHYSLSVHEANIRAFKQIEKEQINAILLQDDMLINVPFSKLEGKLRQLAEKEDVGIVQLIYSSHSVGSTNNKNMIKPVIHAPDFIHGSIGSSESALYVTSKGASLILEYLAQTKTFTSIEAHLPEHLYDEPWVFSVLAPNAFVTQTVLQGDSILVWHTKNTNVGNRTDDPDIEAKNMNIIKKFKLIM